MKRKMITLLSVITALLSYSPAVSAQSASGSGLQISPVKSNLVITPGSVKSTTFTVKNVTSSKIKAVASVEDFEPDISGSPKLLADGKSSPYSIRSFVGSIPDVLLDPGQSETINVKLSLPKDLASGAYYGVLRFQANPITDEKTGEGVAVALTASVGAVVLIQVPGEITEKLQASGVTAMLKGKPSNLFASAPDQVRLELKNTGNGILEPYGTVKITDFRGREIYTYQLNPSDDKASVLPGSSRYFIDGIKGVSRPGKYKIIASITYGNGGDVLTTQASFWLIPVWLAALVAVAILALIGLGLLVKRKMKKPVRRH